MAQYDGNQRFGFGNANAWLLGINTPHGKKRQGKYD